MATYKVVDADQLDADMESLADTIRSKGGTTEVLSFPDGMKAAVEAIQSGGGGENCEVQITTVVNGCDVYCHLYEASGNLRTSVATLQGDETYTLAVAKNTALTLVSEYGAILTGIPTEYVLCDYSDIKVLSITEDCQIELYPEPV